MGKLILHYEDTDTLEMLLRNLDNYLASDNAQSSGVNSITIYSAMDNSRTAYFKRNKSGSYTGKAWKKEAKK